MPRERFGDEHAFLPRRAYLSFEEIQKVVGACKPLGLKKVRITGGEPLLRPNLDDLITRLKSSGVEVALTTNASLLSGQAQKLAEAGLDRVTVSLDALDPKIHAEMTDSSIPVETVLEGIEAAVSAGLSPVKVNCVIQKGVNEDQIIPLVERFRGSGVTVRFIEFMDVGRTNGWQLAQVVPSADILAYLQERFELTPVDPTNPSDVARRWAHSDGSGEIGFISSVSEPFCGDCVRARLSADGRLHTCLFASGGHELRALIDTEGEQSLSDAISAIWSRREDRYSEIRSLETSVLPRVEMSYIGG
tara:strand:+ start:686 stop:1597 length:912 start_codon:yes stop_codon:yes gene_type:complete